MHPIQLRYAPAVLVILVGVAAAPGQPPVAGKYSPADYTVTETRDQRVQIRDGARLVVDIFRPDAQGQFPAVLCQTPYNKNGLATRAKWFAERGYAMVNSDSRGRFESEGEWDPFSAQHKTDGYDLVQWIARQPWSNGRVGTYGLSYMGWTQWWTATQTPPALKCIVPEVAPPDQFYNGPYQNGILVCWAIDWAGNMAGRTPNIVGPGAYGGFGASRLTDYGETVCRHQRRRHRLDGASGGRPPRRIRGIPL